MKLYYSPGACSLSPHIVLAESGLPFVLEKVNLATKKTEHGADYWKVNPKGYVPTLEMNNGQLLTEGPAIVQYLADLVPQLKLAPPAGTIERYRLQEWLNFISTELHKGFSPLFNPLATDDWKSMIRELLSKRFGIVARQLEERNYLMGEDFSVADAYLYTVLSWAKYVKLDLTSLPILSAYLDRIAARPAVHATLVSEKLINHP